MASITRAFAITAIALSALTTDMRPTHAQVPPQATTDLAEPEEEAVFHRLEALELKRLTFPKSIPTQEWQTAFCGWNDDAPRPQYLGTLFGQYAKASRANQALTIKWVDALADELVQRGDAKMFLLLAAHYVRYNQPLTSIYSSFYAQPNTFGLELNRLGNLLKKSLATLSPADQQQFRQDLGEATASYLVADVTNDHGYVNSEPQNGFITAVLGYELMTRYVPSDEGLAAFDAIVKKASFSSEDLQGFFTLEGTRDFMVVASGFMPNITLGNSPLSHLFAMGLRTDKEAGESMRNMFITAIKDNKPEETLFAIDHVYRMAAVQRYAGKEDTLAQQMLSPVWDEAVAAIMTPTMMGEIFLKHYMNPSPVYIPRSLSVARFKQLSPEQEPEMQKVYLGLIQRTVKQPQAFYKMADDFSGDAVFRKAMAQMNTTLLAQNIMPHVAYLAGVYIADANVGSTINSNLRMMHLMQLDGTLKPEQRVTTAAFQRAVVQLARSVKGNAVQSQRLAQFLQTAMNTRSDDNAGWGKHITTSFIETLRKTMDVPKGSYADTTLNVVLELKDHYARVDADRRIRERAWQTRTQIKPTR